MRKGAWDKFKKETGCDTKVHMHGNKLALLSMRCPRLASSVISCTDIYLAVKKMEGNKLEEKHFIKTMKSNVGMITYYYYDS